MGQEGELLSGVTGREVSPRPPWRTRRVLPTQDIRIVKNLPQTKRPPRGGLLGNAFQRGLLHRKHATSALNRLRNMSLLGSIQTG